jgi:hypothetical protein
MAIPFLLEMIRERWAVDIEVPYEILVSISESAMPGNRDKRILVNGAECSLLECCRLRLAEGADVYVRDVSDASLSITCRTNAAIVVTCVPELGARRAVLKSIYEKEGAEFRSAVGPYLNATD